MNRPKTIIITDWASFDQVLPIALKFKVGLEFQEFTNLENLDKPDDLAQLIKKKSINLPLLSMHGPFSELAPASRDPLIRQVTEKRFRQASEIAQVVGAKHLVLHSGYLPKTYLRETWMQNACDFWVNFLRDKPEPGLIHIENVYEDDFSTLGELVDKVNECMHDEMLTICLDIGHVNANSSKSFEDWISGLGDRIGYSHLHNNGGILDDHWRLDQGTIDVNKVLDLLQKHSPRADWSVETTLEDIEPSLQWLHIRGYL